MTDLAINVQNLSKRYRIGLKEEMPDTLGGAVKSWLRMPINNFKQLRQLSSFSNNGHDRNDIIWALKDATLTVKHGEVIGLIGLNGAGKTTLLKILSRITEPTDGRAIINGRVSSLLEVGTGFHPELTGRENVYLNGTILGMSKQEIDRKFDEIVDFSGVEKFIDTPVKRYSSGMQVRLAFAVAAHLEPEILLVDEVLAVGDVAFQKKCLGKMGDVAKQGRTVLFVSHNMSAIQQLCQRCVLLDKGVVSMDGDTRSVVSSYLKHWHGNLKPVYKGAGQLPEESQEKATLLEAEVLNADGEPCQYLRFGEPFSIRMLWQHRSDIKGVNYSIRVFDNRDRFLCAVNTQTSDMKIESVGTHEIRCRFDQNVLAPGDYFFTISCFVKPKTTMLHVAERCLGSVVSDVPYYSDNIFNIRGNPIFAQQATWQITEAEDSRIKA